jgi:hypothetical protein
MIKLSVAAAALLLTLTDAFNILPSSRATPPYYTFGISTNPLFGATNEKTVAETSTLPVFEGEKKEEVEHAPKMGGTDLEIQDLIDFVEEEAEKASIILVDDECDITPDGLPVDELCADEELRSGFRNSVKRLIGKTLTKLRRDDDTDDDDVDMAEDEDPVPQGELLEMGWEKRGNSSALRRNAEVWKFALKCVFRVLKPRKLRKKGASDEEIEATQIEAATFIRDGLLRLGPSFIKLGQVVATVR